MPWTAKSFAERHNHALHGEDAGKAASIANAILKRTGDEGLAIATANKRARADGGTTPDIANAVHLANARARGAGGAAVFDVIQNIIDRGAEAREKGYPAYIPPPFPPKTIPPEFREFEKLPERSRADGGSTPDIANAVRLAHRAVGGYTPPAPPYNERSAMHEMAESKPYGFTAGTGLGRHDKNDMSVGSGSYVLPADVIAGLGDGNSLAGADVWNKILGSMAPYGATPPKIAGGRHAMPSAPHDSYLAQGMMPEGQQHFAAGGETPEVPIKSADGEIIISPEDVLRVGQYYAPDREQGDERALMRRGHRVLDGFVKHIRGDTIRHLKGLKGPVGSRDSSKGHI